MNTASAQGVETARQRLWLHTVPRILNFAGIVLSFGLIAFISWDIYNDVNFLENPVYMNYQFAVCIVFLTEYFYRFAISRHKLRFFFLAFPFLFISIPYLNLITYLRIYVDHQLLLYLCFIPIIRGLVALVMVVTFVTANLSTTVFASYVLVLAPTVYMSGLVFYIAEKDINAAIKNLWYAMWWAGMNVTTIGCYINPMTNTGMALGLVLSLLGIIMFPLFTVYFGDVVKTYSHKVKRQSEEMKK